MCMIMILLGAELQLVPTDLEMTAEPSSEQCSVDATLTLTVHKGGIRRT